MKLQSPFLQKTLANNAELWSILILLSIYTDGSVKDVDLKLSIMNLVLNILTLPELLNVEVAHSIF